MSKVKHYINKSMAYAKGNRNVVLAGVAIIGVIICAGLVYAHSNPNFTIPTIFGMSDAQIGKEAITYINTSGLTSTPATLVKTADADGLVKVTIKIGTSQFDSYVTKDGKLLFPQAFDMSAKKTTAAATTTPTASTTPSATAATLTKTAKPMLEAFVVSSCPFGLQMQRAIAAAIQSIPSLAQYIKVRYIGSVSGNTLSSMHGPEEGAENLRQICIREEQPAKYWPYVSCYMQKTVATAASGMPLGDSPSCQASTGVDTAKLEACVSDPTRGLAYAQKDFAEDTQYNVSGSPTLILDGATIDETSFGGRSADAMKTIICDASTTKPSFCSQTLNTASAATSFSVSYADSTASGSASNTNCAPAAQ